MSGGGIISDTGMLGGLTSGLGGMAGINLSGIPFVGGMFANPAEAQMRDSMAGAANQYQGMREPAAQGFQNMMGRTHDMYQPAHDALNWMYGSPQQPQAPQGQPPQMGAPPPQAPTPHPQAHSSGGGGPAMSTIGAGLGGLLGGGPVGALGAGLGANAMGSGSAKGGLGGMLGGFAGGGTLGGYGGGLGGLLGGLM